MTNLLITSQIVHGSISVFFIYILDEQQQQHLVVVVIIIIIINYTIYTLATYNLHVMSKQLYDMAVTGYI